MSTPATPTIQPVHYVLPDLQERAVAAISCGASLTEAAKQIGVHRNTINNWRLSSQYFRASLAQAQYDRALLHREQAEALAPAAIDAIRDILANPNAAPSVRLRAALAILETATTPPPQPPPIVLEPVTVSQWADPDPLHNSAQEPPATFRRDEPKIGRNDDCPCGSGLKFKRCCLNKPAEQASPMTQTYSTARNLSWIASIASSLSYFVRGQKNPFNPSFLRRGTT
jgi:transposase-like protein